MKRYEKYKPSGVEWIGEIPEHWDTRKVKYLARLTLGKMLTPVDAGGYSLRPYLRAQNINWFRADVSDLKEMWFSENELQKYRVGLNDILVSEGGEVGRTCIWENEVEECYLQNSVHKVTFKNGYDPRYFLYHFYWSGQSGYFSSIVNQISIGHLTGEKLRDVVLLLPDSGEQTAIASYLDRKTAEIDDLIAKKQLLIELLNEEKTAIINQAVTKGLNPDVPMKDSGIPWLGRIPENWEVKKLKYLCSLLKDGTHLPPPRVPSGYPLLSVRNLVDGKRIRFLDDDSMISDADFRELEKAFAIKENDILLAIVGATMGKVSLVPKMEAFAIQRSLAIFRAREDLLSRLYLYYFFQSSYFQGLLWSNTGFSAQPGIYLGALSNFSVACPPTVYEQLQIAESIKSKIQEIETVVSRIDKETELLQEYRTALISEAVTGKIDVRGVNRYDALCRVGSPG
jgi:type I restriction enzyme, S subunit